jgi:hypothetical protein
MDTLKTLFAVSALACLTTNVQAQEVESVTMTSHPSDVVFTVRADKALSTPSVRAYESQVRVRFPDTNAPQVLQVSGDGAAISWRP